MAAITISMFGKTFAAGTTRSERATERSALIDETNQMLEEMRAQAPRPGSDDGRPPKGVRTWLKRKTKKATAAVDGLLTNPSFVAAGGGISRVQVRTPLSSREKTIKRANTRIAATPPPPGISDEALKPHRTDWAAEPVAFVAPVNPEIALPAKLQRKLQKAVGSEEDFVNQMRFEFVQESGHASPLKPLFTAIKQRVEARCERLANRPGPTPGRATKPYTAFERSIAQTPSIEILQILKNSTESACKSLVEHGAPKPTDATVALALDYLVSRDIDASISRPRRFANEADHPDFTEPVRDLAWRIAYKMAATVPGYQALKIISARRVRDAVEANDSPAALRTQIRQDNATRAFMTGANALLDEHRPGTLHAAPSDLLAHCLEQSKTKPRIGANTLLTQALPALQHAIISEKNAHDPRRRLVSESQRACDVAMLEVSEADERLSTQINIDRGLQSIAPRARRMQAEEQLKHARATLRRLEKAHNATWTISALRDGFTSNAIGSQFDKANAEVCKIREYRPFAKAPEPGAAAPRKAGRLHFAQRLRTRKPNPLDGHDLNFGNATTGALQDRERVATALKALDAALVQFGGPAQTSLSPAAIEGYDFNADLPHLDGLRNLARLAIVRAWAHPSRGTELLNGSKQLRLRLPLLQTDDAAEWQRLVGAAPRAAGNTAECRAAFNELLQDAQDNQAGQNDNLTPELLESWADAIGFRERAAATPALGELYTQFSTALRAVRRLPEPDAAESAAAQGLEVTDLRTKNIDKVVDEISGLRLGGNASFAYGKNAGASLSGFTSTMSKVLSAGAVNARFNLSANYGTVDTVGFAVGTPGAVLEIGQRSATRGRAGAGVLFGWKLNAGKAATVGAGLLLDATPGIDTTNFSGVRLRLDRLGADVTGLEGQVAGVAGDQAIAKKLSEVFTSAVNATDESDGASVLEQVYTATPQISVALVKPNNSTSTDLQLTTRAGMLASALFGGTNYGVGGLVSVNAAGSYRWQRTVESTGTTRNRTRTTSKRMTLSLQATAQTVLQYANFGTFAQGSVGSDKTEGKASVPQFDAGMATVDFYKRASASQIQTIEHQGVVNERSYKLITHYNALPFAEKIRADKQNWASRMVAYTPDFKAAQALPDDDPTKAGKIDALLKNQVHIIDDYLDELLRHPHPNSSYVEYLEITPQVAAQATRYRAMETAARKASQWKQAKVFEQAAEALLAHPDSYQPRFLVTSNTESSNAGFRASFGLLVAEDRPMTSNAIYTYI